MGWCVEIGWGIGIWVGVLGWDGWGRTVYYEVGWSSAPLGVGRGGCSVGDIVGFQ